MITNNLFLSVVLLGGIILISPFAFADDDIPIQIVFSADATNDYEQNILNGFMYADSTDLELHDTGGIVVMLD